MDWLNWVELVVLPVVGFLVWLIFHNRAAADEAIDELEKELRRVRSAAAHELAEFKLEVAKEYASITYLKDVETRLLGTLKRIEDKLDRRPVAAE